MPVHGDTRQLAPMALVEMFVLDASKVGDPFPLYWHAGTNEQGGSIIWQGIPYQPMPVEGAGFEQTSAGKLPRPTLRVSNIGGYAGAYVRSIKDGLGAKVTRKRTLGKYLDAANFPAGNPYADPNAHFPDEVFYISRKVSENPIYLEMELSVVFDVAGVPLPRRQVLSELCPWVYRGPYCGYAGPPVEDVFGNPTNDPNRDQCRKTLKACEKRFGVNASLPHGGFPGSLLMRLT